MTAKRKPKRAAQRKAAARKEPCRHPVNRRIGGRCAVCGDQVKAPK